MTYYLLKLALSAGLIVLVSEVSKRSTTFGALLASLPFVSLLAMIWLHVETGDDGKVADLAGSVFWLVLPSLALFLILPPLLRAGWNFWAALGVSSAATVVLYLAELWVLPRLGVQL
ncbi:MAG TPA: DUF3147 family protein [Gemmataceae bacterium]|nr:DUF3147 family protein [Gemmataceae bacterium]